VLPLAQNKPLNNQKKQEQSTLTTKNAKAATGALKPATLAPSHCIQAITKQSYATYAAATPNAFRFAQKAH
jgi:hypothetical protein